MFWKLAAAKICCEKKHISLLSRLGTAEHLGPLCIFIVFPCISILFFSPLLHSFMIFLLCSFTSIRDLLPIPYYPTQLIWVILPWQSCSSWHNDNLRQKGTLCCDTALKGEATAVLSPCCITTSSPAGVSSTLGSARGGKREDDCEEEGGR